MAARKENAKNKSWSRALVDWRFWDDKEALFDRVSKALKKGADLDSIDTAKWTALHFSCFKPNKQTAKVVELLLEKGVALHAVNRDKQTALHLAMASKASLEVVKKLLEKGARWALPIQNRWTVLHYATVYGANIKVVELLLENDEPLAESGGARTLSSGRQNGSPPRLHPKQARQWSSSCWREVAHLPFSEGGTQSCPVPKQRGPIGRTGSEGRLRRASARPCARRERNQGRNPLCSEA